MPVTSVDNPSITTSKYELNSGESIAPTATMPPLRKRLLSKERRML